MKKILVVDNDKFMLEFINEVLSERGHEVVTAEGGLPAVDILKTYTPDIIFVDLVMPNIEGKQLCKIIRGMPGLRDVAIVILSGIATEEDIKIEEFKADACIAKGPINEMAKHILEIVDQFGLTSLSGSPGRETIGVPGIYPRSITKELLSIKNHFQIILGKISEGVLEVTSEGRIVYANLIALSIIEIPEEKLLGSHFIDLFADDDRHRVAELKNPSDDKPQITTEESPLRLNEHQVTLQFLPIDEYATTSLIILNDITERLQAEKEKKKLEAQLQRAQKMEAIGTLAGGIAHDFNNILMAIIGHCDLAKMKLAADSDAIDNLNQVKNAGDRARRLIQQILAFSRMGQEERIALSLTPLIKEALKFLKSTLPTSIEIRDYIEADPGIIEADPTQIHQIVMNLCTNAAHAMRKEGGTLHVKLTRVEVDSQTALQHHKLHTGPHVRLIVADTGCGIDSETLDHIFDPYFTTKEVGEGTGLGLSVVHGIVKTHGGAIKVESVPEKGTTFHLYFPIIEKDEKMQEKPEGPLPTGNERILFVDDEQVILDVGKEMLGELGYDVVTKKSSVEALGLFRADPGSYDLVITDMTMPKMTGDQLAREFMKVRPNIPIILCTGFSPKISEEKAKELGIKAFAMKPLVRRDMANTVRKVLDAGRS